MKFTYQKQKLKVIVVDNIGGLYFPVAQSLTKYFQVYYHSVVNNPFPRMSSVVVGMGYEDITLVDNFWSNINLFDIFIFPDIYFKDWGDYLRSIGKSVWGGGKSEVIETDRKLFKNLLSESRLQVAPTKYFIGLNDLIPYLKANDDKWIKISYFRGDMETYHHINFKQSETWINNLRVSLGPLADKIEFVVEDSINSIAEIGGDGWLVNGNNTNAFLWGLEVKDMGYIGKQCLFTEMPSSIQDVYNQFRPVLNQYNHTGFYSSEIRIGDDGKDYYTDPCMRSGSPPSNVYLSMINNWDEIIIGGCRGELIEPNFTGKYGCEIILKSMVCNNNYLPISYPNEFNDNIKLKGCINVDNQNYIIPFNQTGIQDMEAFGSVVVIGDDINDIINKALEITEQIDCSGLLFSEGCLDNAMSSIHNIEQVLETIF